MKGSTTSSSGLDVDDWMDIYNSSSDVNDVVEYGDVSNKSTSNIAKFPWLFVIEFGCDHNDLYM